MCSSLVSLVGQYHCIESEVLDQYKITLFKMQFLCFCVFNTTSHCVFFSDLVLDDCDVKMDFGMEIFGKSSCRKSNVFIVPKGGVKSQLSYRGEGVGET